MAYTIETNRFYSSDISGRTLSDEERVQVSIKGDGRSWLLDAAMDEDLVQALISTARETTGQGRSVGSTNGHSNNDN